MPEELFVGFELESGETRSLVREVTERQPDGSSLTATTPFRIRALDVSADGSTSLSWIYGDTQIPGIGDEEAALLQSLAVPEIRYSLSSTGDFQGVTNIADVREQVLESTAAVLSGLDADDVGDFIATLDELSDTEFEEFAVAEVALLNFFNGLAVVPGESTSSEGSLQSPFGDATSIPALEKLEVATELDADNCMLITFTSTPDPDALSGSLTEILGEQGTPGAIESFTLVRELRLQLDVATMRPRRIIVEEVAESVGLSQLETESFTYLE